jgi:hypothetical protein
MVDSTALHRRWHVWRFAGLFLEFPPAPRPCRQQGLRRCVRGRLDQPWAGGNSIERHTAVESIIYMTEGENG